MNERKILDVTLPLSPLHQIEYFKDKTILFRIDVRNSKITPKQCFMTLSNMRLQSEIKEVDAELIKEYMMGNFVVETTNMAKICANIILGHKFQFMPYLEVDKFFSVEQYADFIFENRELVQKWCDVIHSVPLHLMLSTPYLEKEEVEEIKANLNRHEGRIPEVGVNLSQILALPDFLMQFFKAEEHTDLLGRTYYPFYFDEYVFSGDKLISFLTSKDTVNKFSYLSLQVMKFAKENAMKETVTHD